MTRDYAKTSNRRKPRARNGRVKPSRRGVPGWAWMLAGVVVGVVASGILPFNSSDESEPATAQQPAEQAPVEAEHKPRFDFYTLLKESEVIVPDENQEQTPARPVVIPEPENTGSTEKEAAEKPAQAPAPEPKQAEKPVVSNPVEQPKPQTADAGVREVYVLQAGSFKNSADADTVRARLLLLNMHANIEKVSTGPGETWHRVLVGPFTNKQDLGEARAVLTSNGIDSIQLRRRL